MVFSLSNIITLFVVLIILAVYRQLDKNNRSLEKVKRYSDKIKDDLDEYVDNRAEDLKNLAIELDVQQQAGREILKRVTTVEENLAAKASDIEAMSSKINEYDQSINRLSSMTQNVEENLKRLQQESEFVDKVGKRIKEAGLRIVQLEKSIPEIKNEFGRVNKEELVGIKNLLQEQMQGLFNSIKDQFSNTEARITDFSTYLETIEEKRENLLVEAIQNIEQAFDEQLYRAEQTGEKLVEELEDRLSLTVKNNAEKYEQVEKDAEKHVEQVKDELKQITHSFHEMENRYHESLEKIARQGETLEDKAFTALKEHILNKTKDVRNELLGKLDETGKEVEGTRKELFRWFQETKEKLAKNLADLEERADRNLQDSAENEKLLNHKLMEMEKKIHDYEEAITYRFTKIEEVSTDIEQLEQNLREAMDKVVDKVQADFNVFQDKQAQLRIEAREKSENEIEGIQNTIAAVENELNELKTKAYDNMSEKLKIFEDDFFSDLQTRNAKMLEQLEEWQKEVDRKVEELSVTNETSREEIENKYNEELKNRFNELQTKVYGQQQKFEDQVSSFQERVNERMEQTKTSIDGFEETIKKEVVDIKENSKLFFDKEFTEYNSTVSNAVKKHERDVEIHLNELTESIDQKRKELYGIMESAQSEVIVWQTKVLQQMKESEAEMGVRYEDLKKEVNDTIITIKEDFNSQRDDLILSTQEERARLKNELKELSDAILTLENDLRKRTDAALDTFNREYENHMLEVQKKNREMQLELDKRIKDFRAIAQDTKEKTEQLQKKLYGKIEENHNILSINLNEIDKRLNSFVAQTKVFDRADSLKISLQENIEDLKTELTKVEAQSNEIREIERKFVSIKKTGEEVSSKLSRFLSEKRRIEEMEGDFKKLINISQAVDTKLDQVTGTHDDLQSVMARIKQLEEMEKTVAQKYDRLENKKHILEVTTAEVDKNFQRIEELEEGFKDMQAQMTIVPEKLKDITVKIESLAQNKKDADAAIRQMEKLESMVDEIEERIEQMQKARDWLARTETRMEEISKEAQEHVKLLGTILKEGDKKGEREKGAPSMGAREVVTRLAHQGWSIEEIARATKLSRGEVELILELLPKK